MATRRKLLKAAAVVVTVNVAGAAVQAAPVAHPDADLLAMAAEAERIDAEGNALHEAVADLIGSTGPEWDAFNRHMAEEMPRWHELADRITRCRARTPEGLRAKARVALPTILLGADGRPDRDDQLVWSVLNDLLDEVRA